MKEIATKHRRFGYRPAQALLLRAGQTVNHKRVYRLWKCEGLAVARRQKKRRGTGPKQERPVEATRPNQLWCVDFLEDATQTGRKLRLLTVTDEFTRASLAIAVGTSLAAAKVAATLERAIVERGAAPGFLRSDKGPEFIATALRGFLWRWGVATAYIEKGSPWQNGFAESFHGRFRDELLDQEVFASVVEARVRIESWRRWYNQERPHSSLGYLTPSEFAARWRAEQSHAAETNTPGGT